MFKYYLTTLTILAKIASYENFVAIQKLETDILDSYTDGNLSYAEKRTLCNAANIISDKMHQEFNDVEKG